MPHPMAERTPASKPVVMTRSWRAADLSAPCSGDLLESARLGASVWSDEGEVSVATAIVGGCASRITFGDADGSVGRMRDGRNGMKRLIGRFGVASGEHATRTVDEGVAC